MRAMIIVGLAVMAQASALAADAPGPPPTPKVDWVAKPKISGLLQCVAKMKGRVQEAVVTMHCVTKLKDHIGDCTILTNSQAPDVRYEQASLCASKLFLMRANGPDGRPIMGAPVEVPFRFASTATYQAIVDEVRKRPQ